ncbi:MAG TPA: magnesium transporter [Minicystis sp.]|nr:magnesium transporter [Minicystis sp.]
MSSGEMDEVVKCAVPVADLSVVDDALAKGDEALRGALRAVRPADVGRDLSRRPADEARRLFEASDERAAAAMLRAAHPAVAAQILARCGTAHAAKVLGFLPVDHRVAVLARVDPAHQQALERALPEDDRELVRRQLAYPESAVGRLMTPKVWRCDEGATAAEALSALREHDADVEVAQNCHVVRGERLVGLVPLRKIAVAPPDTKLASIMSKDPIAVREDAERSAAAEIVQTHDFLSLPVVDAAGRLVGAVRVDDLLDAALEKVGAGILNQGGVSGKIAGTTPYFQTSLFRVVRSRITWLVLLFVAETATGTVLRYFEDELAKVVALSFFIPLLIGTGGNAGSQTVSTVIRALALGEVRLRDVLRVLAKEVATGLLLGVLLGTIALFRAKLWGVDWQLALCVGTTVLVVCTWANTVGALIPIAAERVGIDPTVVSAPLITTLVDASGLFIYLSVAKAMISALRG